MNNLLEEWLYLYVIPGQLASCLTSAAFNPDLSVFSLMAGAELLMRDSQVSYKHPGRIWAENSAGIDGRFAGYTLLLLLARQLAWA